MVAFERRRSGHDIKMVQLLERCRNLVPPIWCLPICVTISFPKGPCQSPIWIFLSRNSAPSVGPGNNIVQEERYSLISHNIL